MVNSIYVQKKQKVNENYYKILEQIRPYRSDRHNMASGILSITLTRIKFSRSY